jgi:hypothetical protein
MQSMVISTSRLDMDDMALLDFTISRTIGMQVREKRLTRCFAYAMLRLKLKTSPNRP